MFKYLLILTHININFEKYVIILDVQRGCFEWFMSL